MLHFAWIGVVAIFLDVVDIQNDERKTVSIQRKLRVWC
jgi:hypothetical protein